MFAIKERGTELTYFLLVFRLLEAGTKTLVVKPFDIELTNHFSKKPGITNYIKVLLVLSTKLCEI